MIRHYKAVVSRFFFADVAELDRAISKLHYAAFQLIPYYAHSSSSIPVTHVMEHDNLMSLLINDDRG